MTREQALDSQLASSSRISSRQIRPDDRYRQQAVEACGTPNLHPDAVERLPEPLVP